MGPIQITLDGPVMWKEAQSLVTGRTRRLQRTTEGRLRFELEQITEHEVIVIRD